MHGILPSQRRSQSVCAVWQRVLQDWTLAFAVAQSAIKADASSRRNELTLRTNGQPLQNFSPASGYWGPVGPRAVPPSCNLLPPYGSTIGSLSQKA